MEGAPPPTMKTPFSEEKLTPNTLRSSESVVCCHLLDQADRLGRKPRLSRVRLRFVLPEHTEELTMPAQQRLRLDEEESLFPGSDHPGQQHQEKPVRFPIDRSFNLSMKNDQLVS